METWARELLGFCLAFHIILLGLPRLILQADAKERLMLYVNPEFAEVGHLAWGFLHDTR